jgi:hypothetical protein
MIRRHGNVVSQLIGILLLALVAGCATTRDIWQPRVGVYTFDQAVLELGPPDKHAKLQDGTIVAEWLTRRGRSYAYAPFPYSYYSWWHGGYYPSYIDSYSPDSFLRLTFGPEGRLTAWKNLYK